MTTLKLVLMILLLAVCGTAVASAVHATQGNLRARINRLFIVLACCLSVWAFSLALTIAARNETVALIGRRLAPLGHGLMICVLPHFILLLTNRDDILRRRWVYPALYLPGTVTIVVFSILPLFGLHPDALADTGYGWYNASAPDFWSWFYYASTLVSFLLCLWLLLSWARQSADRIVKKKALTLAFSLLPPFVLGACSEILPLFLHIPMPRIAAIFMMLPLLAVNFCIKRYHLMKTSAAPSELILSEANRTFVYRNMSFAAFAICVVMPMFKQFAFANSTWPSLLLFSAFWLSSGIVHIAINRMHTDDTTKEIMEAVHFSLLIPLSSFWFGELGAMPMWAIVFPMIIFSLLHNRHIMLTTMIVCSCATQLLAWAYAPTLSIQVGASAYLIRLVVLFFSAGISLYVHIIYTGRLRENFSFVNIQELVSEISHDFISVGERNFDEKLYAALERCGSYIRCDRAYLALFSENGESIRHSLEWLAPGVCSNLDGFERSLTEMRPVMLKQLRDEKIIILRDTALLPPMAAKAKKMLAQQNIRALVALPLKKEGSIIGFLGFNAARPFRQWNVDTTTFLEILTGIITDAVIKVDSEREINFIAYHDLLTRLPNRAFFQDRLGQAIQLSAKMGKMVGVVFADLDFFKSINDTMGHDLGDQLLVEVARRLTGALRRYDTVARFGGDEFMLVINQLSGTDDLRHIMDQLMEAVRQPVLLSGQEFFVTMSGGVARYPQDGLEPDLLIKNADTAMYSAKALGRNRYELCSQDMKDEVL